MRVRAFLIASLCAASLSVGEPAPARAALPAEFIISGAKVFPVATPAIEGGSVWIKDGKIFQAGTIQALPDGGRIMTCVDGCALQIRADMPIVDMAGAWIVPALVDASTPLGLDRKPPAGDLLTPDYAAIGVANRAASPIALARRAGVATAFVSPGRHGGSEFGGGRVLSGQGSIVDLAEDAGSDWVVRSPAALVADAGAAAVTGAAGIQDAAATGTPPSPLEIALASARTASAAAPAEPASGSAAPAASGSLGRVLRGEIPLVVRAATKSEVDLAIHLADTFGIRVIVLGGDEATLAIDALVQRRIPVLLGPLSRSTLSPETAAKLSESGVPFAIVSDAAQACRDLASFAGLAASYGLPWDDALRAVTLSPSEILGIEDRVGSLSVGTDANLLVTAGDPLEPSTKVLRVIVRGADVPLQ